MFATLDQFTEGRVSLHTITGGFEAEQRRDGDYLDKDSATRAPTSTCRSCKQAWT